MNIEYVARHYELDERVRGYTEDKLRKVVKFVQEPVEVRVTLELEKHRHIADLHVAHRFGVLQATEETDNMLDAINRAVDKVEKQARRSNGKFQDKRRRAPRHGGQEWPVDVLDPTTVSKGQSPRIIKSTRLTIKPMGIDEAAGQLESSKNEFVVFTNAETGLVSVLYRRKDNNYGLVSPEF